MRRSLTISIIIWAFCAGAVPAQETPFTTANPFETSGERPIRLFGNGEPPAPFPPADTGGTVLWSAVAEKRDGGTADGLGRGDFTLKVDGKEQELTWFGGRPFGEGGEPFAAPGWYVVLFDLTIADPLIMKEAGAKLLEEMEKRFDADERVAVVFFDGRVDVVVPFTRDAGLVRAALDRLPDQSVYSIHDFYGKRIRVTARGELKVKSTLDKSDDTAQHNFAAYRFFTEIRRLALELDKVPGRKQVMLFSGGFNRKFLAKEDVAYLRMVDAMCRATASVYTYNAVDEAYLERRLEEEGLVRKRAERAGANELKSCDKFLREFAEFTGALAWTAKSAKEEIVQAVFRDGRHHYLLGFPRGSGTRTGNFLPCEVDAGSGISEVRAPLGFYDN